MVTQRPKKQAVLVRFGIRLREKRESKSFSQEDLSALAGLHRTYVGAVERGERNISLLNIQRLAKALDCRISDLTRD